MECSFQFYVYNLATTRIMASTIRGKKDLLPSVLQGTSPHSLLELTWIFSSCSLSLPVSPGESNQPGSYFHLDRRHSCAIRICASSVTPISVWIWSCTVVSALLLFKYIPFRLQCFSYAVIPRISTSSPPTVFEQPGRFC